MKSGSGRTSWLHSMFLDRRGICSRPKLIFSVVVADALCLALSGILADRLSTGADSLWVMKVAVPLAIIATLRHLWSYSIRNLRQPSGQSFKILKAVLLVFVGTGGVSYLSGWDLIASPTAFYWSLLAGLSLMTVRVAACRIINRLTRSNRLTRRTVIVGGGQQADDLIAAFANDQHTHLSILGVFDDRNDDRSTMQKGPERLSGSFADLGKFCQDEGVDLVIVTVPARAEERLLQILNELFQFPVDVRISAHNAALKFNSQAYNYIGSVPMLAVLDKPLSDWDRLVKNLFDRFLAAIILLLASPVMLAVALAVRMTSSGPALFKQNRYGFQNELIGVYKFRSMYVSSADANASKLVTRDDPRVTPVGKFIRRSSLDELPQLFNVLKGEMSLVGPRPHATQAKAESTLYEDVVNGYFARHRVKPGVTGLAQINGWRGETDTFQKIERRVACDLKYIENWSVSFDFYIIAMTPLSLISTKNAY